MAQDFLDNWCEVQVYTLRSNSWRRLEDIQFRMDSIIRIPDMARLAVNGGLHWKAFKGEMRTEIILRFDFEKEEFNQTPIPDVGKHDYSQVCLCVFGGSLWFLNEYGCRLEFWELKDNGVEKSLIRRFTFCKDKFDDMEELTPLWLLEDGKILFVVNDDYASLRFVLYDPEHETTRTLKTCEGITASSLHTCSVYVESLISLDTGTHLGKVQWDWYAPRASAMG
ncbi:F-box/kelch-repeat protein At3g06240-like [Papaver somniferum]|uniref:F-box/kelch-repeat protein At3g06240-like n=1 Tax=Papaver somniferum TaxID=3469 RepID=UPI000E6FA673|nr:F-box/kelch-repeat protein At3g06240-like [Papaver somniferum]XP_026423404.1 F-box/kelch-repeat protein At3g06240-like [Papaver somniferum]